MFVSVNLDAAWGKKVLQVDEDFDDDIVNMYLEIAKGQVEEQTGYDFSIDQNATYIDYIRKSILMQHYGADTYNKDYDFTFGLHADITRLACIARRRLKN